MIKCKEVTKSSGNIFKDLGYENPEERLAKAKIIRQIKLLIKELTDQEAIKILKISNDKYSLLKNSITLDFSLDDLRIFLQKLEEINND
jgi:predicted XRE-type DNA-binding protein